MNRLTGDRVLNLAVYAVMLAIALFFVLGAFQYTGRQRLVPWVIGIPTIALLLFIIFAELSPRFAALTRAKGEGADDAPKTDGTRVDAGAWRRVVTIYAWLVFFLLMVFVVGFYVSVPLFLWLFFTLESKLRPHHSVLITAVVLVPLLLVFRVLLDVPLWPGAIPMIVPGVLGGGSIPPLF